jgi:hypothetical protein
MLNHLKHRFWCWVALKAQTEIVRGTRLELAEHMKGKQEAESHIVGGQEQPPYWYSQWADRRDRLVGFLKQEENKLFMMGGGDGGR